MMIFQGISIVSDVPLCPIGPEDLMQIEAELGFRFPNDYREFVLTIGAGELMDLSICADDPKAILMGGMAEMRDRLAEFWFWDQSPEILTQEKALQCVPFFNTTCGADILFHPSNPDEWFVLEHDQEDETVKTVNSFRELFDFYFRIYHDEAAGEIIEFPLQFQPWPRSV
jgi:SMI1 / KNR4 family (SUKH-1)